MATVTLYHGSPDQNKVEKFLLIKVKYSISLVIFWKLCCLYGKQKHKNT